MKQARYKEPLPLAVIEAARAGDAGAVEQVLQYYNGYINKLCTRTLYDDCGQLHVSICRALLLPFPLLQGNYLSLQQNNLFIEPIVPLFEFLHGDGIGHAQLQQLILFILQLLYLCFQPCYFVGMIFSLLRVRDGIYHQTDDLPLVLHQLLKLLRQNHIQFSGANGGQVITGFAMLAIHFALPKLRFTILCFEGLPMKRCPMLSADNLAAVRMPALIPHAVGFCAGASLLKKSVGFIPYLLRNNGWDTGSG